MSDPIEDGVLQGAHRPLSSRMAEDMEAAMADLQRRFPGLILSLFIYDPPHDGGGGSFNYMSSGPRADMVSVLRAFVERYQRDKVVDRIIDAPPTRTRQ